MQPRGNNMLENERTEFDCLFFISSSVTYRYHEGQFRWIQHDTLNKIFVLAHTLLNLFHNVAEYLNVSVVSSIHVIFLHQRCDFEKHPHMKLLPPCSLYQVMFPLCKSVRIASPSCLRYVVLICYGC